MKTPSKKVIKTARLIISEGFNGYANDVGKEGCPSESDLIKAERLLYDLLDDLKNNSRG